MSVYKVLHARINACDVQYNVRKTKRRERERERERERANVQYIQSATTVLHWRVVLGLGACRAPAAPPPYHFFFCSFCSFCSSTKKYKYIKNVALPKQRGWHPLWALELLMMFLYITLLETRSLDDIKITRNQTIEWPN